MKNGVHFKLFLWVANVLSIFVIPSTNLSAQEFSPDYFQNYWLPANARVVGMGKSFSGAMGDPISLSLNAGVLITENTGSFAFGQSLSAFPMLSDAKTTHGGAIFATGGGAFGFSFNRFKTGNFLYLDLDSQVVEDNRTYSTVVIAGGFYTKSNLFIGFNIESIRLNKDQLLGLGFGIGGKAKSNSKLGKLKFQYAFGANGVNAVFLYLYRLLSGNRYKVPLSKIALGFNLKHELNQETRWYNYLLLSADANQYLSYTKNSYFRFGVEFALLKILRLRGGYFIDKPSSEFYLTGMSYGAGLFFPLDEFFDLNSDFKVYIDWGRMPFPNLPSVVGLGDFPPELDFSGHGDVISAGLIFGID